MRTHKKSGLIGAPLLAPMVKQVLVIAGIAGVSLVLHNGHLAAQQPTPAPKAVSTKVSPETDPSLPSEKAREKEKGLSAPATSSGYTIRATDLVSVSVYQEPELSTTARVADDGTVLFPLLGSISMGGKSVKQVTESVTEALKKDYLVNPLVTVSILEVSKTGGGHYTLLGQVGSPGRFEMPIEGSISIMEAIGKAGGFTRIASPSRITVKRTAAGQERVFKVNGKEQMQAKGSVAFKILPGDIITVGESLF